MKVSSIEIRYEDGSAVNIYANELEKLEKIADAVDLLEQAQHTYKRLQR